MGMSEKEEEMKINLECVHAILVNKNVCQKKTILQQISMIIS